MKMQNGILITAVGCCLAIGTAYGELLSKNPEVAEFQKLKQIVSKQVEVGVSSKDQVFEFQNWLLSTRELLKRNTATSKTEQNDR
jgi:hypothetical protein